MDRLPKTVPELIKQLDKAFPLRNPSPKDDISAIQRKAGQRDVIEYLFNLRRPPASERDDSSDEG